MSRYGDVELKTTKSLVSLGIPMTLDRVLHLVFSDAKADMLD